MGGPLIHHPPGSGDPLNIAPTARKYAERTRAVAGTMPATLDIMQAQKIRPGVRLAASGAMVLEILCPRFVGEVSIVVTGGKVLRFRADAEIKVRRLTKEEIVMESLRYRESSIAYFAPTMGTIAGVCK